MCQFFSAIVYRTGQIRFCEDDSHSTLIARLGLDDSRPLATRGWVRVEARPDASGAFPAVVVDETSAPAWWTDDADVWADRVRDVAMRVQPAWADYERIEQPAWADYQRIEQPAWADYQRIKQAAWVDYERIKQAAWADYQRIKQAAWADYQRIEQPAWADYQRIKQAARADFVAAIRTMDGYVPEVA